MASDNNSDVARITELERENLELRSRLAEYSQTQEELLSHKIFSDARNSLISWIKVVVGPLIALLGIGGYFGAEEIVDKITNTAEVTIQTVTKKAIDDRISSISDTELSSMFNQEIEAQVQVVVASNLAGVESKLQFLDDSLGSVREVLDSGVIKSTAGQFETSIKFLNRMNEPVNIYWIDYEGNQKFYFTLGPQKQHEQPTYVSHPWVITTAEDDQFVASIVGTERRQNIYINGVGNSKITLEN